MTTFDSHLTPEELIDAAEATRVEAASPHLSACASCRAQLADLRASLALLKDADIPEPSPLFWTQFSRRVSEGVAAGPSSPRAGWFAWLQPRVAISIAAGAVAALLLAVALTPSVPVSAPRSAAVTTAPADFPDADVADVENDSSLNLVADLTSGMDLNAAIDAGLTSRESAEHAITHMNTEELATLQRLLKEAMARGGA
jgi:hypothetical protein